MFEINRQFVTEFSSCSSWQMKLCNDERENGASETATSGITGKSIKHFLLPRVAMQAPLHYTICDDGNTDVYESGGHYYPNSSDNEALVPVLMNCEIKKSK